jgi:hypothetical protein
MEIWISDLIIYNCNSLVSIISRLIVKMKRRIMEKKFMQHKLELSTHL